MTERFTKMINNNLDFERNSNTTTSSGSSANESSTDTPRTPKASIKSSATGTAATTTTTRTTRTPRTSNSNDNASYFNLFDNRIAANLAAVIGGARFRSFSFSSNHKSPPVVTPPPRGNINANFDSNTSKINNTTTITSTTTGDDGHQPLIHDRNIYGNAMDGVVIEQKGKHYVSDACPGNEQRATNISSPIWSSNGRRRPCYLFSQANLNNSNSNSNCNDNETAIQSPSTDEDNSPTELNNCKRLSDKPPLVKRLTMGLLRSTEESKPLVGDPPPPPPPVINSSATQHGAASSSNSLRSHAFNSNGTQVDSNGYINEEAFESQKIIASKFGDSCRQSLTAIPMMDTLHINDNNEFNFKKRYLRETSSANSSPKIFTNRMRNVHTVSRYNGSSTSSTMPTYNFSAATIRTNTSSVQLTMDEEEADLKDAPWFQAGISRDIATEILSVKGPGAFLVRKSSSKPGCYALTLRVPSPPGPKVANYIILRTMGGYKIKGFRKEFSSLRTLITHHSVMPELLPIPLAMPRPTNMTSSRRNLDDFDTYDSLQMLLKYLRAKNMENES